MQKPILYCDCDGVIFNTIETAFRMMERDGCDMNDKNQIDLFFRKKIDWQEVFDQSTIINDAINKLKMLKESDLFSDIIILTRLSGCNEEERIKRELFSDYLPGTRIITLQFGLYKASIVANPEKHILIDDEKRNCDNWQNNDGTAILFSLKEPDLDNNIVNDLMDIPNTNGVKKLLKTRYF